MIQCIVHGSTYQLNGSQGASTGFGNSFLCVALVLIVLFMFGQGCTQRVILPPCGVYDIPVRLHITKDRSTWPVQSRRTEVGGCATTGNDVYILQATWDNPQTAQWIVGHELQHLLNWQDKRVPNPDKQ